MKKYSYIVILGLFLNVGLSQNYVDILKLGVNTTPENRFDSTTISTKVNSVDADLTYPIKINSNLSVLTGFIYENIETRLFSENGIHRFGSTTLKLGINKQFNEKWSGTFMLLPKIASDYVSIGPKDYQMGGIILMKRKKHENLNYKLGVYYNSEIFGPFFAPIVGMYYLSPNKKFEANLLLPLSIDVNYRILSFMNVGFNFMGQNRSYHITNTNTNLKNNYVVKSTNDFYGYLRFNVTKNLNIFTKVGHSVARSYRVYADDDVLKFGLPATFIGPKREQLNKDFSDGILFQFILNYRFNLDPK